MTGEARRALVLLADVEDGVNELMLNQHGFTSKLLDRLVAAGHARIEHRNYGARGSTRLDIKVRRFHVTAAGKAAIGGAHHASEP